MSGLRKWPWVEGGDLSHLISFEWCYGVRLRILPRHSEISAANPLSTLKRGNSHPAVVSICRLYRQIVQNGQTMRETSYSGRRERAHSETFLLLHPLVQRPFDPSFRVFSSRVKRSQYFELPNLLPSESNIIALNTNIHTTSTITLEHGQIIQS